MIARTNSLVQSLTWQQQLSTAVTDPLELLKHLGLSETLLFGAQAAAQQFKLRVPWAYVNRIKPGDPADPLLLQVLPVAKELEEIQGYTLDPLGEQPINTTRGILHKYHGRLLLVLNGSCAVNCRYCFRRHFPYDDNRLSSQEWDSSLDYIRKDSSIKEVILSGGDPLMSSDHRLRWLTQQIAAIPHVERLRIHSRLPIVLPARVTSEMIEWFSETRLQPIMVVHCNHPNEIDSAVKEKCELMQQAGITLLNQSVLLKDINDDVDTLVQLSGKLFATGIMPYYLHLLDKVQGAAHFDICEHTAQQLIGEMMKQSSGYLVPKLARESAEAPSKLTIPPLM